MSEQRTDDYQVIRWRDWCRSKGFSLATGERLRRAGRGPRVVQLGERMIGVTRKADREWTLARERDESPVLTEVGSPNGAA